MRRCETCVNIAIIDNIIIILHKLYTFTETFRTLTPAFLSLALCLFGVVSVRPCQYNILGKYGLDVEEEGEKLSWENYFKKVSDF